MFGIQSKVKSVVKTRNKVVRVFTKMVDELTTGINELRKVQDLAQAEIEKNKAVHSEAGAQIKDHERLITKANGFIN